MLQRGERLQVELVMARAYMRVPPRNPSGTSSESTRVTEHTHPYQEGEAPNSTGTEAPALGTLTGLALCIFFIWLFIYILHHIL